MIIVKANKDINNKLKKGDAGILLEKSYFSVLVRWDKKVVPSIQPGCCSRHELWVNLNDLEDIAISLAANSVRFTHEVVTSHFTIKDLPNYTMDRSLIKIGKKVETIEDKITNINSRINELEAKVKHNNSCIHARLSNLIDKLIKKDKKSDSKLGSFDLLLLPSSGDKYTQNEAKFVLHRVMWHIMADFLENNITTGVLPDTNIDCIVAVKKHIYNSELFKHIIDIVKDNTDGTISRPVFHCYLCAIYRDNLFTQKYVNNCPECPFNKRYILTDTDISEDTVVSCLTSHSPFYRLVADWENLTAGEKAFYCRTIANIAL